MTTIVPDVSAETAGPATGGLRVALGIPHERLRSALADWLEQSGRISVVHRQEDGKAAGAAARRSHADVVVLARQRWAKRRSAPLHAVPEALGDIPLVIVGRDGGGASAQTLRAGGAADNSCSTWRSTRSSTRSGTRPVAAPTAWIDRVRVRPAGCREDCTYSLNTLTASRLDDARLRRLLDAARALVAEIDVDSVLRHTLEAAADLADARYAAIGVIAPDGTSLARFETLGVDAETAREIGDLPTGHGVLGLPISEPRRLRLPDIGAHARSYGFPLAHPPMRSFMGVPLAVRGEAWGCIYVTEASHGTFDETDEEALVALAELASAAIGTATAYHSERTRADALERSISGLAATTEIARAIGGETRLDRVLELVVKRARALVEARAMLIMLIDGDDLVVSAIAGDATTELLGTRYPVRDSAVSALLATGQAERIDDATTRLRLAISDALQPQTGLIVPLVFHGHVVGALEAFDRTHAGPAFSDEDERLLEAFSASAAIALGSARDVAAETLRRSIDASERERARWARELHDETLQELGAISMTLASAHESDDVRTLQEAVSLALGYDEYAMRGLREIITDLRPGALRALGVKAALELLVARTRKRSGIDVALDVDLDCEAGSTSARHAPALEAGLYRIAQEAIANAVKHAHASAISIRVAEVENGVRLTVEDDGRGFDYMGPHASGFGLIGMHERAELIHGTLTIESRPGKGTVVQVFAPSERRPPPAAPWSERRETAEEEGRTG